MPTSRHDPHRDQAALYALGALPAAEARDFETHLRGCAGCRAEVEELADVAGDLALAVPPVAPPARLRDRLLAEAAATPAAPFQFVLAAEGEWLAFCPGVRVRLLAPPGGARGGVYLIRMDAGAVVPMHTHHGVEHCYVVEGDLHVAGRHIHAGDHHVAAAGSTHEPLRSDGGCLLLIAEGSG